MKKSIIMLCCTLIAQQLYTDQTEDFILLHQQLAETKKLVAEQQETIKLLTIFMLEERQKRSDQEEAYLNEQEAIQKEWDQTHWFKKTYTITRNATEFVMYRYIIPAMISSLTHRIAEEANIKIGKTADLIIGDGIDHLTLKLFGNRYGVRPYERLYFTSEGRKFAQIKRELGPDFTNLSKQADTLEAKSLKEQLIHEEKMRLERAKTQAEHKKSIQNVQELDQQLYRHEFAKQAYEEEKAKKELWQQYQQAQEN